MIMVYTGRIKVIHPLNLLSYGLGFQEAEKNGRSVLCPTAIGCTDELIVSDAPYKQLGPWSCVSLAPLIHGHEMGAMDVLRERIS